MKFLKNIFGKQKGSKSSEIEGSKVEGQYLRISLNEKIMPLDRGEVYEDPIDEILKRHNIGEVTGGGTLQLETGEIKYCNIEIFINSDIIDSITIRLLKDNIEELGAPKGSKIIVENTGEEIEIGKLEGIGFYLDGLNLPEEVYKKCDINEVIGALSERLGDHDKIIRYGQGNDETALYFYGKSFFDMKEQTKEYINEYPLCRNARIEQIA